MNWEKLKQKGIVNIPKSSLKRKKPNLSSYSLSNSSNKEEIVKHDVSGNVPNEFPFLKDKINEKTKEMYVGLDCEMVGIGTNGKISALARCCVVDYDGNVIYDEFVRPPGFVTDFRTKWSGVRSQDLREGKAVTLKECQEKVSSLIKGKILVGHALKNDMSALMLNHPRKFIRDTATYRPLMRTHGKFGKFRPRSLKDLSKEYLQLIIQTGEHDPGEDARCAMFLYRYHRKEWEKSIKMKKDEAMKKSLVKKAPILSVQQELENNQADDQGATPSLVNTSNNIQLENEKDKDITNLKLDLNKWKKRSFNRVSESKKEGIAPLKKKHNGMFDECSTDRFGQSFPSITSLPTKSKLKNSRETSNLLQKRKKIP